VSQIWLSLQTTTIPAARIDAAKTCVSDLLMALFLMKYYPTENILCGMFKQSNKTVRKVAWAMIAKLQALKAEKVRIKWCLLVLLPTVTNYWLFLLQIVWPDDLPAADDFNFVISVDGTHCRINEPQHPTMSKNKAFYSHKFNQAGLNYEIGLSPFDNQLTWVKGPMPAGTPDITVFRNDGLKGKLPLGKKAVEDRGYRGEPAKCSIPNCQDTAEVRLFKSRAGARHESVNARFKNYGSLNCNFRHGIEKHKAVFEAVCVVVQFQFETGSPLFDV
jgi:hypothetical protein